MTLEEVQDEVAVHMDDIVKMFKPGAKVTVLVRFPGFPERDFLMTSDDTDGIIEAVARRQQADTSASAPGGSR